ncbi:hypothetical protein XH99_25910 [Bradyrhizobium nanningense]|uniref:Uncharacterized protein n=1 Tax=Bradyrhizobium nanningense TaxID=1325118 RepID=A0A4Q0S113_9BRAD|nr:MULTISPECIES: hypothetical protein [Bradyrhizobium]RXH24850.1 hypothetical protein XH99_25910 [Bradyrhizobium nanningense]RXH32812.1 hypothetical protein XH84_11130 [Bradyrhizobium nanningense]TQF31125.1 hypothetical protein UNPA324_17050 [Bradyrhizobium sp. UNPA324]
MQTLSLTADVLAVLALICVVIAVHMIRLRRNGQVIFNGGILLALGLAIACALPILSRLPWTELADEASEQAVATLQLLHAAYVILTL